MWAPSRSNKCAALAALLLLLPMGANAAGDGQVDPLARYRGNDRVHGLYEIREAARAFLTREGAKKKVDYRPMDPSIQVVVPRCLVPLTARWARKTIYHDGPGVDVLCKRSVEKKYDRSWDVFVPLFEPEVAEKWRLLEEKNRRDAAAAK